MVILNKAEVELLADYILQVEAVVQADDGTLFPTPFLAQHEEIMEIFMGDNYEES